MKTAAPAGVPGLSILLPVMKGFYFQSGDPTSPPPPSAPASPPPSASGSGSGADDNNAFRRRFEDLERRHQADKTELDTLRREKQERDDKDKSDNERLTKRAEAAERERDTLKVDNLRARLARNLPDEAMEFITATDEAGIKAQVEKLTALYSPQGGEGSGGGEGDQGQGQGGSGSPASPPPPPPPVRGGQPTNPQRGQQPTIDEQIKAAQKSGDRLTALRLKREQAGISQSSGT